MKVMKFHVAFDGYYGGNVDEYVLLPFDINGVLFEELSVGEYDDAIYLGEIAGKHSECYGDLEISVLDLEKLSLKEISDILNSSSFGEFEVFFEGVETDYREEYEEEYDKNVKNIMKKYDVSESDYIYSVTEGVYCKFIEELKNKYVKSFKNIIVLEEDYEKVMDILKNKGIKTF